MLVVVFLVSCCKQTSYLYSGQSLFTYTSFYAPYFSDNSSEYEGSAVHNYTLAAKWRGKK